MNTRKDWTIMVYLAGDNNLGPEMARAVETLKERTEIGRNINLLAYFDGSAPDVPTLYCDLSADAAEVFQTAADVAPKPYRSGDGAKENSASAESVVNFVDWCVNRVTYRDGDRIVHGRRADRYALIFSGHSAGFQDLGLMPDDTVNGRMTLSRLAWAVERLTRSRVELTDALEDEKALRRRRNWAALNPSEIERETEVIIGQKLSILGFDSCLMGMLEVAHEFEACAETMIASEGSTPNSGWNYAHLLGALTSAAGTQATATIAERFVTEFVRSQNALGLGGVSVDLAAHDLAALPALNLEFEKLASCLLEALEGGDFAITKRLRDAVLQAHWSCQSYSQEQNVDLSDFCRELRAELETGPGEDTAITNPVLANLANLCRLTEKAVRETVIISGFSGGKYQYSNGIAVFFPWTAEAYRAARPSFETLQFVRATDAGRKWNRFLEFYLETFTRRMARPAAPTFLTQGAHAGISPQYPTRIPVNPLFRTPRGGFASSPPEMPDCRIPSNPTFLGNAVSEVVSGGDPKFTNVESPSNISGFTRRRDWTDSGRQITSEDEGTEISPAADS